MVADENPYPSQCQPTTPLGTPQVSPQESQHHRSPPAPITWHNNSQRTYSFRRLPGLSRRLVIEIKKRSQANVQSLLKISLKAVMVASLTIKYIGAG